MPKVCFFFWLHQPYRLTDFSVLSLGNHRDYFATAKRDQNQEVFLKVADTSYRPMLKLLLKLAQKYPEFKFSFSASGVFLEQAQAWAPDIIKLLQTLAKRRRQVEIMGENYYHSLSALYSPTEFKTQVKLQEKLVQNLFGVKPKIFRNTEMIYDDEIAAQVAQLGYQGMLTEAVDKYLAGKPRTQVWRSHSQPSLPLLLKHAQLSDDIAFRFSQQSWSQWPLTADKYIQWLTNYYPDEIIGLMMDFETFGEHQWASTGIFAFFEDLVKKSCQDESNIRFITPSDELVKDHRHDRAQWLKQLPIYRVPEPISWADEDRDLSAWRSNSLQVDALAQMYQLEKTIIQSKDQDLIRDWRRLQTSDHYYYMCTKYFADGDVHAYFSAYNSPLEGYRRFCIVLADLIERCRHA